MSIPPNLGVYRSTELVLCSIQESGKGEETSSIIRGGNSNHLLEKNELEQPVARVLEPDVLTTEALEPNFKYAPTNTTANITSTWEDEAHAIEMLEYSNHHHHQQQQQQQNDDALVGLPELNGRLEEFMNPEWLKQMEQQDLFDWTSIPFDGFLDANDDPHLFPPS
ncbi:hypothetical protein J5N97_027568 [Dioscorea zingiberensis]|uniref:Uncharacterized protein n=1 Tax=Dioscorea zingiberensis TaxID=325984 RepID=A0A9D5C527_9LILI|nr:hypothetical protein J5N97_027568 [Dioscorea zingiberensis]